MKNVYISLVLVLLFSSRMHGQGSDVIFWMDDSGSISNAEFLQMRASIQTLIENVLDCNSNNRVAVVHYGAAGNTGATSRIYIESDFTNNATVATNILDRTAAVGGNDFAHEALSLIGNALDGVGNVNIVSPQQTLSHISSNSLVIYLFTDAVRSSPGSFLVNSLSSATGSNAAFTNYTVFKNQRNATFIVTLVGAQNSTAAQASAAIASAGGAYTNMIESYLDDPDGPGTLPRFLLVKGDFNVTALEAEIITDDICSVTPPDCVDNLILVSPVNNVASGIHDNREAAISITASNQIAGAGVGIYHADDTVVLTDGFHSANSSRFRAYIEGCSGEFEGRPGSNSTKIEVAEDAVIFKLSPNPATDIVTLSLAEAITNVTITSLDGKVMFSRDLSGKDTAYDVDIRSYGKGIYAVNVTTAGGNVLTQKLIKN
jgi:hypothetical protein